MTNQNTTSKEPERDSDRLRLHTPTTPSAVPLSSSAKNEILELSNKQQHQRLDNDLCSPSPPSRVPSSPASSLTSIYQRKHSNNASATSTSISITGNSSHHIDSIIKEEPTFNDHRVLRHESMEDDDDDDNMKNEVGELENESILRGKNYFLKFLADVQASRYSSSLLGNSVNSGTRQSPLSGNDLPGPSGIGSGPVQHAPLVSNFEK